MPRERTLAYYNHTLARLATLNYSVKLMNGATPETPAPPGMHFNMQPHEIGNFLIHEGTWAQTPPHRRVVTIEADTFPLRPWSSIHVTSKLLDEFDALFLQQHPNIYHKGCATANPRKPRVLPGYANHTFGIGATLWTNRRPLTPDVYTNPNCATGPYQSIELASDVWLDCAHKHQLLRVGQLCPYVFYQDLQHCARRFVQGDIKVDRRYGSCNSG
eukprot:CAMPEP_0119344644 /NCGR_PEP_ID=MMETSP1333-20130426/107075_1 /TAXON_ID=418940 /ORGANISM="Scyphosphaera apsteinii, Strain RCC1455" /LENGTH=215 /DNA_ID=CAMNT_0007357085 /DNA_START=98 /DNA_END=745 /DNA_ORIENTATION=-